MIKNSRSTSSTCCSTSYSARLITSSLACTPRQPSGRARKLAGNVVAKEACSACYGSLIHALQRLDESGRLRKLPEKVCIGQGFRGTSGPGIGVGACTNGFARTIGGCPPTAKQIGDFLEPLCK